MESEKLCLQWNDFQTNLNIAFKNLREDSEFNDVTLACEDGSQVEAHKFVLAASSPVFQNLLRRKKHAHPLFYMRGMKSQDLQAIVDFLYCGETNVFEEDLDSFLTIAEELQLKGFIEKSKDQGKRHQELLPKDDPVSPTRVTTKDRKIEPRVNVHRPRVDTDVVVITESSNKTNNDRKENEQDKFIKEYDEIVKSKMEPGKRMEKGKRLKKCKHCDFKEMEATDMKIHISQNHMSEYPYPQRGYIGGVFYWHCPIAYNDCKPSKTRNALKQHLMKHQKNA